MSDYEFLMMEKMQCAVNVRFKYSNYDTTVQFLSCSAGAPSIFGIGGHRAGGSAPTQDR